MSDGWMNVLVETYDVCIKDVSTMSEKIPLVPICHTVNNAHITVTISDEGRFISAEVIDKDGQNTIIPCTEESEARTSAPKPHPLDDKLIYLVDDISRYGATVKPAFKKSHSLYMSQLLNWVEYDPLNVKIASVYKYLKSGTLIDDLVSYGVLTTDDNGLLAKKSDKPDSPLFSVAKIIGEQSDAFIRWAVVVPGDRCIDTWKDESIMKSWTSFVESALETKGLCYVTGDYVPLAKYHPKKIRNSGDGAKIISSNDSSGFTYRGRFDNSDQACTIGFETTQKMHSALRWVIGRQGYHRGELCIVAWTISGDNVRNPADDMYDELAFDDDSEVAWTNAEAAHNLNKRLRGYSAGILDKNVMILGLDSATSGKGRIAVTFFRKELGDEFVKRLEFWHTSCAWIHRYAKARDKEGNERRITFVGAPSPKDIAMAAYGSKADDRIIANVVKRILPCIIDGERIPWDLKESVVRRACNPVSMEKWEWEKTLSIACSVFKQFNGGKYEMVLEKERKSRDYLYGRLLAIADLMEGQALRNANESRQTTALRLMQRFSEYPYSTWKDIELALVPYASRLGDKAGYYEKKISEIMDLFEGDDFRNNSKLGGEFLLAYHCQRQDQFRKKEERNKTDDDTEEE